MAQHSRFSASGTDKWLSCSGMLTLIDKLDIKNRSSSYAIEGTKAHDLLDKLISEYIKNKLTFNQMINSLNQKTDNQEEVKALTYALERFYYYIDKNIFTWLASETRFNLSWIRSNMFGTGDICLATDIDHPESEIVIIDYKHGQGKFVDIFNEETQEANRQLKYYALGLAKMFDFKHKYVTIEIIQPRCVNDELHRSLTITMDELKKYIDQLGKGHDKVKEADADYDKMSLEKWSEKHLMTGNHCNNFCNVLPYCPKHYEKAIDIAKKAFANIEVE